jgi:hypothetical protein
VSALMSFLIESLSTVPPSLLKFSFPLFFIGLGMLMSPALRIAFGRWHEFSGQRRAHALSA